MTRCARCNRNLTAPASIAAGYGPTCLRNARAEATATGYSSHQINQAEDLIALAAIVRGDDGNHYAVSTDGDSIYTTTRTTCDCPAADRGTACYHRAAVVMTAG